MFVVQNSEMFVAASTEDQTESEFYDNFDTSSKKN